MIIDYNPHETYGCHWRNVTCNVWRPWLKSYNIISPHLASPHLPHLTSPHLPHLTSLAAGQTLSESLHVLDALQSEATPPPITVSNVVATRPWSVRQKRIGTKLTVSYTCQSSEPTIDRKDSLLSCLHMPLAYKYYHCIEETREHVSLHSHQGKYELW